MASDRFYIENKLKHDWLSDHINVYRAFQKATGGRVTTNRDGTIVKCHFDCQDKINGYFHSEIIKHFGFDTFTTRMSIVMEISEVQYHDQTPETRVSLYNFEDKIKFKTSKGIFNVDFYSHQLMAIDNDQIKEYLDNNDPDMGIVLARYISNIKNEAGRRFVQYLHSQHNDFLMHKRFEKIIGVEIEDTKHRLMQDLRELSYDCNWSSDYFDKVIKRILSNRDLLLKEKNNAKN